MPARVQLPLVPVQHFQTCHCTLLSCHFCPCRFMFFKKIFLLVLVSFGREQTLMCMFNLPFYLLCRYAITGLSIPCRGSVLLTSSLCLLEVRPGPHQLLLKLLQLGGRDRCLRDRAPEPRGQGWPRGEWTSWVSVSRSNQQCL